MLTSTVSPREGSFFSQRRFVEAVARADPANVRVVKIQSINSAAHLYGLERAHRFNRRSVSLGPFGLYAHPINADGLEDPVSSLLWQLKSPRTVRFEWNVRFDHGNLARQLETCGLNPIVNTTHVLNIDRSYGALFGRFSQSTRNQIRRSKRHGVEIRRASDDSDLARYYMLYQKVINERPLWNAIYGRSLFNELFKLSEDVMLITASVGDKIIGGGLFFIDGNSLFYWHGVMDCDYTKYSPHYAIINHAILLACERGMTSVNLGASLGIGSLELFKSFWGSQQLPYWRFFWQNPMWSFISRISRSIRW